MITRLSYNCFSARFMIIRLFNILLISLIIVMISAGCGGKKDDFANDLGITNGTIGRISINDRNHRTVDIVDSVEIEFFLRQLRELSSRVEGNVKNEYTLTIYYNESDLTTNKFHVTSLLMGMDCIGLFVPASDITTRWYFENDSLYQFIVDKFQQVKKDSQS